MAFAHSQSPRLQTETLSRGTIDLFVVEKLVYQKKKMQRGGGGGSVGQITCHANPGL